MYCTNCGKKIKKGAEFCPNCGEPLMNLSSTEPEAEKYETLLDEEDMMPSGGKWKWILAMAIAVCVVAGISGIFVNVKIKDDKYDKKIEEARKYCLRKRVSGYVRELWIK